MITAAPLDGDSNALCDWLELEVLASREKKALLGAINQGLEMEADVEPEDFAEEDELKERRVGSVLAAIDERKKAMPKSYPFALDDACTHLTLVEAPSHGGVAYLFCLIVSSAARDGALEGAGPWTPDLKSARDLFQVCATISSAGWVRGPAFSVGHPRVDGTGFIEKLHQIYPKYGDGRPHKQKPPWAPQTAKDDEIDILAFKHEPDGQKGTLYFIGQAASGANYRTKSVKNAVETFHSTWFEQPPASPPTPGLVFPFVLPNPDDGEDHVSQEVIAGENWRTAKVMGALIYRHRIAHNVDVAHELAAAGIAPIERLAELSRVGEFVTAYIAQLIQAVETLS